MRRVGSRAVIAVLTIGVATLLVGLGDGRAQDAGEVRLGAFMPISGISADVGAQIKAGIEVAVERTQQPGLRIGGKPHRVRVIWYDTEGKGDVGLNVVTGP
jgi:ABC-type branched-subunit amino acid transport system substrate-binding protein